MVFIDTLLQVEFFLGWLLLSTLARLAARYSPDAAMQMEAAAMGAYMMFQDASVLPLDLRQRLRRRMVVMLAAITCFVVWPIVTRALLG